MKLKFLLYMFVFFIIMSLGNGFKKTTVYIKENNVDNPYNEIFSIKEITIKDMKTSRSNALRFTLEENIKDFGSRVRVTFSKDTNRHVDLINATNYMKVKKLSEHLILVSYGIRCGTNCRTGYAAIITTYNDSLKIVYSFIEIQNIHMDNMYEKSKGEPLLIDSVYDVNTIKVIGSSVSDYSLLITKSYYHYSTIDKPNINDEYTITALLNFDIKKIIFFNATPSIYGEKKVIGSSSNKIKLSKSCCSAISLGEDMYFYNGRNIWYRYIVDDKDITTEQTTSE